MVVAAIVTCSDSDGPCGRGYVMTRQTLALLLCFASSGCMVGIITTGVENIRPENQDEKFLRSLDYHASGDMISWLEAVGDLIGPKNLSIQHSCSPKDRPLLCIESREKKEEATTVDQVWLGLSFLSFAVIPYDMGGRYEATFTLYEPGKGPARTEYTYKRHMISWLPFVVAPDFWVFFTAFSPPVTEKARKVEIEEKRRLLLRFSRDTQRGLAPAKPQ